MAVEYHRIISQVIIKPIKESIYSELATTIELAEEGAGCFLKVSQSTDEGLMVLSIDIKEWPAIRDGIDYMMEIAIANNESEKNEADILPA